MSTWLVIYYAIGIAASIVAAISAYIMTLRRGWAVPQRVLIGMIAVVPPLLLAQQLLKFASLHMYTDISHWLQILNGMITTGTPHVLSHAFLVPGTSNYFSVHFVPLLYLFALPFKLLPYPQTLLILNIVIMSSAAIPLYLLARHRTGDRRFALLMAALLLWYPTFQYMTLYEFEMLRFSIPILLWMLYAWERRRIGWYYALVLLATLVREEVGLTVGMFGVFLMLVRREWRHGFATAVLGFGAFGLITGALMPAFRSDAYEHVALGAFGTFGRTPADVAIGVFAHPFRALAVLLDPVKLANIGMLFLPLLFLPLLAPLTLIPVLPTLGIGLLSAVMTHSSYMLYYVAPAVPFMFLAGITAWPQVTAWLARRAEGRYGAGAGARAASSAMGAVVAGVIAVTIFFGPSPFALQFWSDRFRPAPFRTQSFHRSAYWSDVSHRDLQEILALIPEDAIVSTQQFLMPMLFRQRGLMVYPQLTSVDGTYRADYVLLDRTNNGLRVESPAFVVEERMDGIRNDVERWSLIARREPYVLYRVYP